MPGAEERAWSGLGSRSADSDNNDPTVAVRANTPSTPSTSDSAKDSDYNKKYGYWVPLYPAWYVCIGIGICFTGWLIYQIVACIVGGSDTVRYFKSWKKTIRARFRRRAERREAKSEVVAPA